MAFTIQAGRTAEIIGGVVLLGLLVWGVFTWLGEHDARLKAEATVATNQKLSDAADAKLKLVTEQMDARDKASSAREQSMIDAVKNLKTTPQILPYVQSNLAPGAPAPIIVTVPAATAANPTPDATITVPQIDLPILRDRLSTCNVNAIALTTCQQDKVDDVVRLKLAGEKLSAMQNERDAYKTQLKGGTFWQRAKKAAKIVGFAAPIGAAIGVAAVCGSGHCK